MWLRRRWRRRPARLLPAAAAHLDLQLCLPDHPEHRVHAGRPPRWCIGAGAARGFDRTDAVSCVRRTDKVACVGEASRIRRTDKVACVGEASPIRRTDMVARVDQALGAWPAKAAVVDKALRSRAVDEAICSWAVVDKALRSWAVDHVACLGIAIHNNRGQPQRHITWAMRSRRMMTRTEARDGLVWAASQGSNTASSHLPSGLGSGISPGWVCPPASVAIAPA
eukprot:365169-Chlamydomonas_euryale.AAC.17